MDEQKEERRVPNWLGEREDYHMKVKNEKKLTEYQLRIFVRELKHQEKMYSGLVERTPQREKAYKPTCKTREELDQMYMLGAMTDREYMRNRSAIWNCYSDRGYIMRIEWLREQVERYQDKLDRIDQYLVDTRKQTVKACKHRYRVKKNKSKCVVRCRRRKRQRERKQELEARWKKYGITPSDWGRRLNRNSSIRSNASDERGDQEGIEER